MEVEPVVGGEGDDGPVHDAAEPLAERVDLDAEGAQRDPVPARRAAVARRGLVAAVLHRRQVQLRPPAGARGGAGAGPERAVGPHGRHGARRRPVPALAEAAPLAAAQAAAGLAEHARPDERIT